MRRTLKVNINTKKYWDQKLKDPNWGKERGLLYKKILKYLPKKQKFFLLDVGCANGHGIIEIKKALPNAEIEACDFSTEGIRMARKLYGRKIRFFIHNIYKNKLSRKYDIIIIIETLEHVVNPKKFVKKYLKYCKKLIVTVPYRHEGKWKEHLYKFYKNSFKDIKEFKKCEIIRPRKKSFPKEVIIYIFRK